MNFTLTGYKITPTTTAIFITDARDNGYPSKLMISYVVSGKLVSQSVIMDRKNERDEVGKFTDSHAGVVVEIKAKIKERITPKIATIAVQVDDLFSVIDIARQRVILRDYALSSDAEHDARQMGYEIYQE